MDKIQEKENKSEPPKFKERKETLTQFMDK
jgi:ribosomal protein S30